jgi:hypothetical protein
MHAFNQCGLHIQSSFFASCMLLAFALLYACARCTLNWNHLPGLMLLGTAAASKQAASKLAFSELQLACCCLISQLKDMLDGAEAEAASSGAAPAGEAPAGAAEQVAAGVEQLQVAEVRRCSSSSSSSCSYTPAFTVLDGCLMLGTICFQSSVAAGAGG